MKLLITLAVLASSLSFAHGKKTNVDQWKAFQELNQVLPGWNYWGMNDKGQKCQVQVMRINNYYPQHGQITVSLSTQRFPGLSFFNGSFNLTGSVFAGGTILTKHTREADQASYTSSRVPFSAPGYREGYTVVYNLDLSQKIVRGYKMMTAKVLEIETDLLSNEVTTRSGSCTFAVAKAK